MQSVEIQPMKILICGPEGSGKTTLAKPFAELINAVYVHRDSYPCELRGYIDGLVAAGNVVVIDKRCDRSSAVEYLHPDFVVWLDMRTAKTQRPYQVDYHIEKWFDDTPAQLVKVLERYTYWKNKQIDKK